MAAVAYDKWERFEGVIERARIAAANQGHDAEHHFPAAGKVIEGGRWGTQTVSDYELTRFAAYLVVMNGDPRKPEIAAAQQYFAVRTREAETAGAELDEIEVAERYLMALKEKRALAARVAALEGPAAQAETFRQADGLRTVGDLANDLKVHAATNFPGVKVLQQDVFDLAGRVGLIIRGNTVRHNQPTARAIEAGWVKPKETPVDTNSHGSYVKVSARLTPRGYGRLWDAAIAQLKTTGSLSPKEISR